MYSDSDVYSACHMANRWYTSDRHIITVDVPAVCPTESPSLSSGRRKKAGVNYQYSGGHRLLHVGFCCQLLASYVLVNEPTKMEFMNTDRGYRDGDPCSCNRPALSGQSRVRLAVWNLDLSCKMTMFGRKNLGLWQRIVCRMLSIVPQQQRLAFTLHHGQGNPLEAYL